MAVIAALVPRPDRDAQLRAHIVPAGLAKLTQLMAGVVKAQAVRKLTEDASAAGDVL